MCRSFSHDAIPAEQLLAVLDAARWAPAAGNTAGLRLLLLEEPAAYWDVTLGAARRDRFPWPGLLAAPVLVVVLVSPGAYVARYGEADKAGSGLGRDAAAWAVPYWFVDGGMAAQNLLLAAEAEGLGACFFGLFEHEAAVLAAFGVADGWRAVGTVALGWRDGVSRPSQSAARGRPSLDAVVVRPDRGRNGTVPPFSDTEG